MREISRIAILSFVIIVVASVSAFSAPKIENVTATGGMVSSAHVLASQAGAEILRQGGNAVDAAVATSLALNVVEPKGSGIGGGGFMIIALANGKKTCIDYREIAGKNTEVFSKSLKPDEIVRPSVGGKSVCTPGFVKAMEYVLRTYGTMTFAQVAQPAIKLAEEGFEFHETQNAALMDYYEHLESFNDLEKVPFFEEGMPIPGGAIVKQHALAKTFRLIGEKGEDVFYKGEIADAIVAAVGRTGGNLTKEDLASYSFEEKKPVSGTYRGYKIYSMPPSSSGGACIIELLNIMENFDLKDFPAGSARYANLFLEASKLVRADRRIYMADPNFVDVPLNGLTSKRYAKTRAEKIVPGEIAPKVNSGKAWDYETFKSSSLPRDYIGGLGGDHISTTSLSAIDEKGNMVTATNTINHYWGSCVYVPEYGFFLNDEMADFTKDPKSVNAQAPGKRPLSSMSPTLIYDPNGKPFMSIGSAGAARIITAIAQTIINVIDRGMSMDEAIEEVRFHDDRNLIARVDEDRVSEATVNALKKMGYEINLGKPGDLGTLQAIMITSDGLAGGADSRRLGAPVGVDRQ